MPFRGVNVQGAFRSKLHSGHEGAIEVVPRVAHAIKETGFQSIRISGQAMTGGTYDRAYAGNGWAKYCYDNAELQGLHSVQAIQADAREPFNYHVAAIEAAALAGVSVYLGFHRFMDNDEVETAVDLCEGLGVRIEGFAKENEPYLPARFDSIGIAYDEMARFPGTWPAMAIVGEPIGRQRRELETIDQVAKHMDIGDQLEVHAYCPEGRDPFEWIQGIGGRTMAAYGVAATDILVGEWSGKGQYHWGDADLAKVIQSYLAVFDAHAMRNYYQALGSEYDTQGLWNFTTMTPNRGAELFAL